MNLQCRNTHLREFKLQDIIKFKEQKFLGLNQLYGKNE